MAVAVGNGRSSMALKMPCTRISIASRKSAPLPNMAWNSVMSAPTMKASLALVSSRPWSPFSPLSAVTASSSSPTTALESLLTDSSFRSRVSLAMSSPPRTTVMALP